MLVRLFERDWYGADETQRLLSLLHDCSDILQSSGARGLIHRDFAAVVIVGNYRGRYIESDDWQTYLQAVVCEAWIGNEEGFRQAKRDYLSNARSKAYTSWRLGMDNGTALALYQGQVPSMFRSEDSRWPGAIRCGSHIVATSALMPEEDDIHSLVLAHRLMNHPLASSEAFLRLVKDRKGIYRSIYPPDGVDTVGGASFDRPPTFDGFQRPFAIPH